MKQTIDEMAENWFSKLPSARHARGEIKESFLIAYKDGYADAQRWHYPSKGELPCDDETLYLLCDEDGCIDVGSFNSNEKKFNDTPHLFGEEVIAWQYLPEPPKETN